MAVCRKVLDISYAKDRRLTDWLKQSKQHLVVLTEYFAIEVLNAQDERGVAANFEILRNYSGRVLVAKPDEFSVPALAQSIAQTEKSD